MAERPKITFVVPASAILARDPLLLNASRCRSCHEAIVWTKTEGGMPMPLSAKLARIEGESVVAESHFADCPQSKSWSKAKARSDPGA
jgi:hypothetical protein